MEQSGNKRMTYVRWFLIRLVMIVYDIAAVNVAYFAALVIRFYVAYEFNIWAVRFVPAFFQFAPYYTVCCLIVFFLFKLYNSKWKYAGLNDLNRIVNACLVTCVIQVVGSVMFVMRMPISYYGIGAVLQFALIAGSRFAYRFVLVERNRLRKSIKKTSINVMIVGVGEASRTVLKHLERETDNATKPVCLVDFRGNEFGEMMEGIPVVNGLDKIESALRKYSVESVIMADAVMPETVRKQIREICQKAGVNVQEFTSYFQNSHGVIPLRNLMEYTKGPVELVIDEKRLTFPNGELAITSLAGKYVVNTISAEDSRLVVVLQKDVLVPNDVKEEWVRSYKEETGEDISFF